MTVLTAPALAFVFDFPGNAGLAFVMFYALLLVIPVWKICAKAGHPGWYSLILFIPLLNVVALYLLAFTEWPIEREKGNSGRM